MDHNRVEEEKESMSVQRGGEFFFTEKYQLVNDPFLRNDQIRRSPFCTPKVIFDSNKNSHAEAIAWKAVVKQDIHMVLKDQTQTITNYKKVTFTMERSNAPYFDQVIKVGITTSETIGITNLLK